MGRKLKHFICSVETEMGQSSLFVVHRYRGGRKGFTDFYTGEQDGPQRPSFSLTSPDTALELARFLEEEVSLQRTSVQTSPSFDVTGFAIKVLCDGKVIKTITKIETNSDDIDSFTYSSLKKMYSEYGSDEYYFVVYSLKDHGMSRETLETVVEACAEYQKAVLISGDLRVCRPMILKDIEDITGYDIATVSRAIKGTRFFTSHRNYSLDSHGVSIAFPSLLNEGITIDGERVCTFGIREKILAMIEVEDKSRPLTDEIISEELGHFGYKVARKTVQKYRESLGVPNSNKRRIR